MAPPGRLSKMRQLTRAVETGAGDGGGGGCGIHGRSYERKRQARFEIKSVVWRRRPGPAGGGGHSPRAATARKAIGVMAVSTPAQMASADAGSRVGAGGGGGGVRRPEKTRKI